MQLLNIMSTIQPNSIQLHCVLHSSAFYLPRDGILMVKWLSAFELNNQQLWTWFTGCLLCRSSDWL